MVDIIVIFQDAGGLLIWPICIVLLLLIMVQGGAGDISSAFGGGGQLDSSLGVGAQQKISKVTGWFVTLFLLIVVVLSIKITGGLGEFDTTAPGANTNGATVVDPADPAAPGNEVVAPDNEAAATTENAEAGTAGDNAEVEAVEAQPEAAAPAEDPKPEAEAAKPEENAGGAGEIEEVE